MVHSALSAVSFLFLNNLVDHKLKRLVGLDHLQHKFFLELHVVIVDIILEFDVHHSFLDVNGITIKTQINFWATDQVIVVFNMLDWNHNIILFNYACNNLVNFAKLSWFKINWGFSEQLITLIFDFTLGHVDFNLVSVCLIQDWFIIAIEIVGWLIDINIDILFPHEADIISTIHLVILVSSWRLHVEVLSSLVLWFKLPYSSFNLFTFFNTDCFDIFSQFFLVVSNLSNFLFSFLISNINFLWLFLSLLLNFLYFLISLFILSL